MGRSDCTQQAIDRWVAKVEDPVRSPLMRFRGAMEDDERCGSVPVLTIEDATIVEMRAVDRRVAGPKPGTAKLRGGMETKPNV